MHADMLKVGAHKKHDATHSHVSVFIVSGCVLTSVFKAYHSCGQSQTLTVASYETGTPLGSELPFIV